MQSLEFCSGDGYLRRIRVGIDDSLDRQTSRGCGTRDEFDHGLHARERAGTPVDGDVREELVFDLVPLARARREVADAQGEPRVGGQTLQFFLSEPAACAVRSAAIGHNQEGVRGRILALPVVTPPPTDTLHREGRRVVILPHVHEARVL